MDRTANHLASYGRHGDDTLLHVSRAELEGIRQLTGKDFTRNPHTGLPEAFNLSDVALPALSAAIAGARRLNRPSDNSYTYPDSNMAKTSSGQISGTAMPGEPGMFVGGGAAPNATSATDAVFANQLNATGPAVAPNGMPLPPVPPANPDAAQLTGSDFYRSAPGPVTAVTPSQPPSVGQSFSNLGNRISNVASDPGAAASQVFKNIQEKPFAALTAGAGLYSSLTSPSGAPPKLPGTTPYDPNKYPEQFPTNPRQWTPDPAGYTPGVSNERRYFAKGGIASMRGEEGMTANVVNEAKAALLNEHPRPKEALARFEGMFGADALGMLRDKMVGGRITGAGGGMDDLIPGTIEGRQKVRLADGEFVLPAHIVSAIGDGSTDQGVRRLHEMMDSIYKQKYKSDGLPKRLKKGTLVDGS